MKTASALLVGLVVALPAGGEQLNRIVLRVNDRIATYDEYRERRNARVEAISEAKNLGAEERKQLIFDSGRAAMKEIFDELLVLSRAQQLHLEASEDEIQRAVENARKRFGIQSDEQFSQALAQSGTTLEAFRQKMANNILFNEVIQREVTPKVKVDDEEVARYWREHPQEFGIPEQRQIEEALVRDESAPGEAERAAMAEQVRAAVAEGKSVTDAVAGLGLADKVLVLDHGWVERGALDATLEKAAWELAAGGVSPVTKGRGGLHVLRVVAVKPASVQPLDTVRAQILDRMRDEQYQKRSEQFLDELAAKAFVVEHLPAEAEGYRSASVGERDPVRALMRGAPAKVEKPAVEETPEPPPPTPPPAAAVVIPA
jgi:parvulin-like peptidyl-prolyl isomerase